MPLLTGFLTIYGELGSYFKAYMIEKRERGGIYLLYLIRS